MCLFTKQIMPIKARKEIVVYKVVKIMRYNTVPFIHTISDVPTINYFTPCMLENVHIGKLLEASGSLISRTIKNAFKTKMLKLQYYNEITDGYIHCFTTKASALAWIQKSAIMIRFDTRKPYDWAILECIISPKTLYYKSYDGKQICARSVYVQKIALQG